MGSNQPEEGDSLVPRGNLTASLTAACLGDPSRPATLPHLSVHPSHHSRHPYLQDQDWDLCLDPSNLSHIPACCGKSPISKEQFALREATPLRLKNKTKQKVRIQNAKGRKVDRPAAGWEGEPGKVPEQDGAPPGKGLAHGQLYFKPCQKPLAVPPNGKWDRTMSWNLERL